MKQITLPSHVFMHATSSTPVDVQSAIAHTVEARENGKKVILCGLFVEREIEALIGYYLYPGPNVSEQQTFVAAHILGSDALTFAHKKRLVVELVNQQGWLKGEAKSLFDKDLRKVMSLRNAFTHGNIIERDSTTVLEYFEAGPRRTELTDDFWTAVETAFNAVVKHIEAIKDAAGIPRTNAIGAA